MMPRIRSAHRRRSSPFVTKGWRPWWSKFIRRRLATTPNKSPPMPARRRLLPRVPVTIVKSGRVPTNLLFRVVLFSNVEPRYHQRQHPPIYRHHSQLSIRLHFLPLYPRNRPVNVHQAIQVRDHPMYLRKHQVKHHREVTFRHRHLVMVLPSAKILRHHHHRHLRRILRKHQQ